MWGKAHLLWHNHRQHSQFAEKHHSVPSQTFVSHCASMSRNYLFLELCKGFSSHQPILLLYGRNVMSVQLYFWWWVPKSYHQHSTVILPYTINNSIVKFDAGYIENVLFTQVKTVWMQKSLAHSSKSSSEFEGMVSTGSMSLFILLFVTKP